MEDFHARLFEESNELYKKFVKLDVFLRSEEANKLNRNHRMAAESQLHIMQSYLKILELRLELLED